MAERTPISLRFEDFELDEAEARLLRAGRPVALAPKAFALLCALARRPGQLLTKDALLDETWGHRHVSDSVLKTTISQLRAALGDDARQPRFIETASRHGYRLLVPQSRPAAAVPVAAAAASPREAPSEAPIARAAALERLHAAWAAVAAGQRRLVWLTGEAGVGKTTLIEHFAAGCGARLAAGCGARIAQGQCVQQFGSGEPYLPVLEALAALSRSDPTLVALLHRVAPTWLLQLPWLSGEAERQALQQQLAGVHPDRMLREAGELLDRYTQEQPLLLVTEDLHWSDHATVRLLEHLARRRTPARLLWLASFRPAELVAEGHPLKGLRHELRAHRLAEEIALEPFSELDLAAYLQRRLAPGAAAVPEAVVRALHAHTDGLPLFVTSVVDELLAAGGLGAAQPDIAGRVPETLAGIVERRLERLPAAQRQLIEVGAVHGVEFRPDAVAAALDSAPAATQELCELLARPGQWLRPTAAGYEFRHALVRHAVYQGSGAGPRARWHGRLAQALEALRAQGVAVAATELATHCERAQDPLGALRHYAEAARSALGRFAPTEAVRLTGQALALLPRAPDAAERPGLELALVSVRGIACSMLETFSADEAKRAFERALELCERLPQTPQRAWAMSGLGWVLFSRADYAGASALAQRSQAAGDDPEAVALQVSACILQGVTLSQQGDWAGARAWLDRGQQRCDALGDALPLARFVVDPRVSLRALRGLALLLLDEPAAAMQCCDEALALARSLGHPTPLLLALWCGGMLDQRLERLDRVREYVRELERLSRELGLTAAEGPALWLGGWLEARSGDARAGHARIAAGIDCHRRSGRLAGLSHVMFCAAEALLRSGDTAAAGVQIEQGFEHARRLGEGASITDLLLLRARVARAEGRHEAAAADFDAALEDAHARRSVWLERQIQRVRAEPGT